MLFEELFEGMTISRRGDLIQSEFFWVFLKSTNDQIHPDLSDIISDLIQSDFFWVFLKSTNDQIHPDLSDIISTCWILFNLRFLT